MMKSALNVARRFIEQHERIKKRVHTAWRYPLPPWGRAFMGFVYFSVPVVGGYAVMQWAIGKAHESIGERGEKLEVKEIQGIGDKRVLLGGATTEKVGAGGIGGGVRLANSDQKTQEQNKIMLEAFLKQQEKRRNRERS